MLQWFLCLPTEQSGSTGQRWSNNTYRFLGTSAGGRFGRTSSGSFTRWFSRCLTCRFSSLGRWLGLARWFGLGCRLILPISEIRKLNHGSLTFLVAGSSSTVSSFSSGSLRFLDGGLPSLSVTGCSSTLSFSFSLSLSSSASLALAAFFARGFAGAFLVGRSGLGCSLIRDERRGSVVVVATAVSSPPALAFVDLRGIDGQSKLVRFQKTRYSVDCTMGGINKLRHRRVPKHGSCVYLLTWIPTTWVVYYRTQFRVLRGLKGIGASGVLLIGLIKLCIILSLICGRNQLTFSLLVFIGRYQCAYWEKSTRMPQKRPSHYCKSYQGHSRPQAIR